MWVIWISSVPARRASEARPTSKHGSNLAAQPQIDAGTGSAPGD
jgi:hypothetical protein